LGEAAGSEILAGLVSWVEQTDDVVGVCDAWGRLLYLNPAACKLLGVGGAEGVTIADVFPNESFDLFFEVARPEMARRGSWSGEVVARAGTSGLVRLHVSATMDLDPDGASRRFVLIGRVLATADADTVDVAVYDEALGALGRHTFEERLALVLSAARDGGSCAVVVYDFSDVASAASAHGNNIVDQVMRSMALRLRRATFTTDSVGALSEHQLAVLLRGIGKRQDAFRIAEAIGKDLREPPVETTIGPMPVAIRYGVAFSHGNDDPVEFLHAAAPPQRNIDTTGRAASERRALEPTGMRLPTVAELQPAFSLGEVKAYAQAVIDPTSRTLVGYRGFAQWHHQERGVLGPSIIEQIAGDTALASVIDLYVARQTATLLVVASRERPLAQYTTASRRTLLDIYTEQRLDEIATAYFLAMHQIHLLIDATTLTNATTRLRDAIRALADTDLTLVLANVSDPALDLEDLAELGFRTLELSSQLVNQAAINPTLRNVVVDLTDRAHRAEILVAANDINTEQQHDTIQQIRCDLATGDLYAPKQPTENLIDE
jgi:EAL domain-containing protein (putative c-di-GMP-specific phosphodiesterase class I)/GGDEF domain-containing protein